MRKSISNINNDMMLIDNRLEGKSPNDKYDDYGDSNAAEEEMI